MTLQITFENGMPDQICYSCLKEIQEIYAFIKKCEISDIEVARFKDKQDDLRRLMTLEKYSVESDSCKDVSKIDGEVIDQHHIPNTPLNEASNDESHAKHPEKLILTADFCAETEKLPSAVIKTEGPIFKISSVATLNTELGKPIICCICSKTLSHKRALRKHMTTMHSTTDQSAECDICHKIYKSKKTLRGHKLAVHADEIIARSINTAVQCPVCSKIFENNTCLNAHMQSHSQLSCQYCSKRFRRELNLIIHLETCHSQTTSSEGIGEGLEEFLLGNP